MYSDVAVTSDEIRDVTMEEKLDAIFDKDDDTDLDDDSDLDNNDNYENFENVIRNEIKKIENKFNNILMDIYLNSITEHNDDKFKVLSIIEIICKILNIDNYEKLPLCNSIKLLLIFNNNDDINTFLNEKK